MLEINRDVLRERVKEAWRNACEGGYEENLRAYNDCSAIAGDMIAYDDDISSCIPDDCPADAYPDALEKLNEMIAAMLPEIMALCFDEGCPHHGTEHVCITRRPDDQKAH